MFLIPLLLSATLDLTLPEFQPEVDASGNYIVGYFDEVEEESVVDLIPATDLEIDSSEDGGLSPSEEVVLSSPSLRAIEVHNIDASTLANYRVSGNALQQHSGDILYYIYLTAGIEYTITSGTPTYTCKGLWKNSVCTAFSGTSITPEENLYLVRDNATFSVSYTSGEPDPEPEDPSGNDPDPDDPSGNDPEPEDPSGNDPSGGTPSCGDFDDTNIVNSLNSIQICVRALMFIVLIQFLYPLSMSIVRNIVGGDKNV